jgi:hypothetical protein
MEEDTQDIFIRAYARLTSLKKNIDQINTGVSETYVNEYHTVLNKLEEVGIEVSEFRIPDSLVKPRVTSSQKNYSTGVSHLSYSNGKYIDKSFLLTKLDAILGYFEIITSKEPRKIGFRKPDNK